MERDAARARPNPRVADGSEPDADNSDDSDDSDMDDDAPGGRVLIDAHLANYAHLGLIHLLFPDAVIVHVARQPLDQLWSCLRRPFDDAGPSGDARAAVPRAAAAEAGEDWSNSLGDAARTFLTYEKVMDHFLGKREAPDPADEETAIRPCSPDAADGEARALAPPSPRGADRALPARARALGGHEELVSEPTRSRGAS